MNPPTDVLLLCWRDTDHPQGGGSERFLERVGAQLAARGHRVTLVTAHYPGAPREERRDGMRVVRTGGRLTVYPRALVLLLAARLRLGRLAGCRPDVVVDTQNGVPFFATLVTPAPTVVLVHHCHREQWPVAGPVLSRLGWFLESRVSPRVHRRNRYVTVSAPSAAELAALGVDEQRISIVRAGIDPVPDGLAGRSPADEAAGARLVVLSRLVPHKQIEDALAVLARLRESGTRVRLDVVGGGWWEPRLREAAQALGVAEHVVFHGHVTERRKHELLRGADLHLMPSRKEGWGLAVVEAAQHGVPTAGYRSSAGLADSIVDGETGVLADGVGELAAVTAALLAEPERLAALGEAARVRAQRYSWSRTADGFSEVLAEVAASPAAGAPELTGPEAIPTAPPQLRR